MKRNLFLIFAGALVIGLLAAGCGSDDTSTASEALTKQEFITQADAICQKVNDELDAASERLSTKTTDAQFETFVNDELVPNVQSQVDQIGELVPPEADQEQINELLDSANDGVDEMAQDPSQVQYGDPLVEANTLAADYGLRVCGQD
jgi:ABC-type glycerol-3-phosphate transport system substrate-binding protein